MKPTQTRFDKNGDIIAEPLLSGDSGQQLDLFGTPAQTGESLAIETAGPMFAGQYTSKGEGENDDADR